MRLEPLYRIRFTYPESWAVGLDGGWQQLFFIAEGRCEGWITGRFRGANFPRREGADGPFRPDFRAVAGQGLVDPAGWHPEHQHLSVPQALVLLADAPPAGELVVCHGDSCAPNTLLTGDGRWAGHVDLGALGVADRWADLAVATWSATWNYGPGWEAVLLNAYGVAPDPDRTRFYRLLYDLGP